MSSELRDGLLDALATAAGLGDASIVIAPVAATTPRATAVVRRPDAPIYPASMIKLPIAAAIESLCDRGRLSWKAEVPIDASNLTTNDAPSPFVEGSVARIRELVVAMIAASDNVATNVLIDVVGREALSRECATLELEATVVARKLSGSLPLIDDPEATGRNAHPAIDAARLLLRIARDDAPAGRALAAQIWNDRLPQGLRPGDRFAHKTGDTDEVSHDGGILTLANGRRYVVVVYTVLASGAATDARFATFMRTLRPYLAP
ncbi:MAG: hypothetical protein NVSMB21_00070 [Vulcanimicrobiaceae bacterium]